MISILTFPFIHQKKTLCSFENTMPGLTFFIRQAKIQRNRTHIDAKNKRAEMERSEIKSFFLFETSNMMFLKEYLLSENNAVYTIVHNTI